MHRAPLREPSPLLRRNIFACAVADGKLFTGAGRFVVDRDRRYVRIRLPLRFVFLGQLVKSPGHRPLGTYQSIQAVLSDSHIDDFCPRGADFREEGVLRSKARVAHVSAGPRVPLLRRPARCREASLLSLARMQVERGSPYPSRAFSARCLPRRSLARPWRCRRPLSQRHARSFPLAAVPLSHLAPAISMARNSRSTSRFQLCRSPNESAEVPAAFRNGHFECGLSVGISLATCSVTLGTGSVCVRGMLAQRMESSGPLWQIQPVRGCGRAH